MPKTIWTSPVASQEIVDGPEVLIRPGRLSIRFTSEELQYELAFSDVIKFCFTEFGACNQEHLAAYDKLVDLGQDSALARDVFSATRRDIRGHSHYRIFFDDAGAYDVVAAAVQCP